MRAWAIEPPDSACRISIYVNELIMYKLAHNLGYKVET
jgi:hypothetical protein